MNVGTKGVFGVIKFYFLDGFMKESLKTYLYYRFENYVLWKTIM